MKDQYRYKALATRVLAVVCYSDKTWMVYVDAVPGMDHDREFMEVVRHGTAMDERLAKLLFPDIADKHLEYAEDD